MQLTAQAHATEADFKTVGRKKKKIPTAQVRLAEDVIDLAWKIAPYHGHRTAGDFLSEFLRPLLTKMEADQRAGKVPTRPKGDKPKGGDS
jgi:hypothetical protein